MKAATSQLSETHVLRFKNPELWVNARPIPSQTLGAQTLGTWGAVSPLEHPHISREEHRQPTGSESGLWASHQTKQPKAGAFYSIDFCKISPLFNLFEYSCPLNLINRLPDTPSHLGFCFLREYHPHRSPPSRKQPSLLSTYCMPGTHPHPLGARCWYHHCWYNPDRLSRVPALPLPVRALSACGLLPGGNLLCSLPSFSCIVRAEIKPPWSASYICLWLTARACGVERSAPRRW